MCVGLDCIWLGLELVCLVWLCISRGFSGMVNGFSVSGLFMRVNLESASATRLFFPFCTPLRNRDLEA